MKRSSSSASTAASIQREGPSSRGSPRDTADSGHVQDSPPTLMMMRARIGPARAPGRQRPARSGIACRRYYLRGSATTSAC
jgi:hypothetical protein